MTAKPAYGFKPCRVCGRLPNVASEFDEQLGCLVRVSCGSWLRDHRVVCIRKPTMLQAVAYARAAWNGEEVPREFA